MVPERCLWPWHWQSGSHGEEEIFLFTVAAECVRFLTTIFPYAVILRCILQRVIRMSNSYLYIKIFMKYSWDIVILYQVLVAILYIDDHTAKGTVT